MERQTTDSISGSHQTMELPPDCKISRDFLMQIKAEPNCLFQPNLYGLGDVGIIALTDPEQLSWELCLLIRRLEIPEDQPYSRFNGWYWVKKYDQEGGHSVLQGGLRGHINTQS